MTATLAPTLPAVLAAASACGAPAGASQLVAQGNSDSPYALRHAIKVPARLAHPALTRWLVWLGDARPPHAPSHVRLGLRDPAGCEALRRIASTAGCELPADCHAIVLPYDASEPLFVISTVDGAAVDGADVATASGQLAWREVQVHDGTSLLDPGLRLAGLVAQRHHHQVLAGSDGYRLVLLVRPRPGTASPW